MESLNLNWCVLRSKPSKEQALYKQIMLRGFEVYYPCQTYKPVNPRASKTKPYFAGYMFVHINLKETGLSLFQWMPYSAGLVNFDGEPATIPDNMMQALIRSIGLCLQQEIDACSEFLPNHSLRVIGGPFAGYEAIFNTRLPGNDRIRILLNLAQGNQISVDLPAVYVEKKQPFIV